MPKSDELPEGIKELAYRQEGIVSSGLFPAHVDRLIQSIDKLVQQQQHQELSASPSAFSIGHPLAKEAPRKSVASREALTSILMRKEILTPDIEIDPLPATNTGSLLGRLMPELNRFRLIFL
jgi:hypothetical protein